MASSRHKQSRCVGCRYARKKSRTGCIAHTKWSLAIVLVPVVLELLQSLFNALVFAAALVMQTVRFVFFPCGTVVSAVALLFSDCAGTKAATILPGYCCRHSRCSHRHNACITHLSMEVIGVILRIKTLDQFL